MGAYKLFSVEKINFSPYFWPICTQSTQTYRYFE